MNKDTKVCSACAVAKSPDDFNKDKSKRDGLCSTCRECNKARAAQWYLDNKETALEQRKERFQNKRDIELAQMRAWRKANPVRKKQIDADWYAANTDRAHAYGLAWQRANKEKVAQINARHRILYPEGVIERSQRRRARKNAATIHPVRLSDIRRLRARFAGLCAYCRESPGSTLDHVVPLDRGGSHSIGNLLPACRPCNSSKHTKFLFEWIIWKQKHALAA